MLRTQVVIIGAGPSGLLLAQLLHRNNIDSIVLERKSRDYVEARIRAGLLEWGTVDLLQESGAGDRMMRDGLVHDGFSLAFEDRTHRIDLAGLSGRHVMVYGQTEIQKDLADARTASRAPLHWESPVVAIEGIGGRHPRVDYLADGKVQSIDCDFVIGCDGYHGIARQNVPSAAITVHERVYPFGWLGILADVPPVGEELTYANHSRGFALCSLRSKTRARYYLQCALDDAVEDWSDARFWEELAARLPVHQAANLIIGPSIEKSIAPLRSFVAEPMRFGRLFLVGDAAHIVPPTGAKGLNLAAADVRVLYQALVEYYRAGSETLLGEFSALALGRVWKATRFSWWFTTLMHKFPGDSFDQKLQLAELEYLSESRAAAQAMAENYVGLPV